MGGSISAPVKAIVGAFGNVGSSAPAPSSPAPTTAEVSQSSATDATQTVLKRRRGKSPTILTSTLGATGNPITESKTLLGG